MSNYISTTLASTDEDVIVYFDRESGKITDITTADKAPIDDLSPNDLTALQREVLQAINELN